MPWQGVNYVFASAAQGFSGTAKKETCPDNRNGGMGKVENKKLSNLVVVDALRGEHRSLD